MAYYELVSGDEYDTLYFGGTTWEGASDSRPTLTKSTKAVLKNDLTSGFHLFDAGSSSSYKYSTATYITEIDLSGAKASGSWTYAFYGCTGIASVIGDFSAITNLDYCFYNCSGLTSLSLSIPSCTSAKYLCYHCTNLSSLNLINYGLVEYFNYAFAGCSKLATVGQLKFGATKEADYFIADCPLISTLSILTAPNLTSMNYFANNCSGLISVDLPKLDCVAYMNYAFANCTSLEEIELPDLPSLCTCASIFSGCTFLQSVKHGILFSGGLATVSYYAVGRDVKGNFRSAFYNCSSLTTFDFAGIGAQVVDSAFYGCQLLQSVSNLSSQMITDATSLFEECTLLSQVDIYFPNILYSDSMFKNSGITKVNGYCIGSQTANSQFYGCSRLTTLNMTGPTAISTVNTTMFSGCTKLVGGNGTSYDPNNCGSALAVVDDSTHIGYLTDTKDTEQYTITYNPNYYINTIATAISDSYSSRTYYWAHLYKGTIKGGKYKVAKGDTINLSGNGVSVLGWVVITPTLTLWYEGDELAYTVNSNATIQAVVDLSGSQSLNAVIEAISDPH